MEEIVFFEARSLGFVFDLKSRTTLHCIPYKRGNLDEDWRGLEGVGRNPGWL
jgi:hypothetical protein